MPTKTSQRDTQKVPKLRFAGFVSELKRIYLKDAVLYSNSGVYKKAELYGSGSNIIGVSNLYGISSIDGQEFRRVPLSKKETDECLLEEADLLYADSSMVRDGIAKTLFTTKKGAGTAFAWHTRRYKVDSKIVDSRYLYYQLGASAARKFLMSVATQTGLTGITTKDYFAVSVILPSVVEQQKIAEFLGGVDEWIENLRAQKESFESYKKGMAQKIFSQEIRFKDDNGNEFPEWGKKKLGSLLNYEQPTNYIVESTEYSDKYKTPVLTAGKTFVLGYTDETNGIFEASKLPVIIFDDFTTTQQFVDFPFKVKSSAMKILRAKDGTDIKFIYEAMQLIKYEIGGHGRHWISKYSNIEIAVPSLPEQQKIAEFLGSIDKVLESKQQQITQAEQWKKGLMQGLFV